MKKNLSIDPRGSFVYWPVDTKFSYDASDLTAATLSQIIRKTDVGGIIT